MDKRKQNTVDQHFDSKADTPTCHLDLHQLKTRLKEKRMQERIRIQCGKCFDKLNKTFKEVNKKD